MNSIQYGPKEIWAATVCQRFYRHCQKLPLKEKIELLAKQPLECYTNETLKRRYLKSKKIGKGADGAVFEAYKVKEGTKDWKKVALKISSSEFSLEQRKTIEAISILTKGKVAPHLTPIYHLHSLSGGSNFDLFGLNYLIPSNSPSEDPPCTVTVMERLEGNFKHFMRKSNLKEFPKEEFLSYPIQIVSTKLLLRRFYNVSTIDGDSEANIFYKKLGTEDSFRGKKLIGFKYWKYTIAGIDFYIPRPKLLIKLGDYDRWKVEDELPPLKTDDELKMLQSMQNRFNYQAAPKIEELKKLFKKPSDPQAKILDIDALK